jgi:hypothetical protein
VLKADSTLYFFDGTKVEKLTKYRTLGATSDTDAPTGITIPSSPTYYATSKFVMALGSGELVVVTREGKVIKDSGVTAVDTSCEAVTKSGITYKLNTDGTSSNVTATIPDEVLVEAGDRFLVKKGGKIYLSSSECSITGAVEVVDIGSSDYDAKMVKVGNNFYIAVRDDTNLYYRKVSGSAVPVSLTISLDTADTYYYALDGRGRLYAITADDTVEVYNVDGTPAGTATVTGVAGLLGLADRVLAKDGSKAYEITTTGSEASKVDKGTSLYEPVDKCTDNNTQAIDGAGTNFIRCAHNDGLYSLTYDSGSGLYSKASYSVTISSASDVKWATDKVLVKSGSSIKLCSTTTTPSISCSDTDLLDLDPTNINDGKYLKFNGNNVFYKNSSGTLKVGNVFDPTVPLPITVSLPSGGNASFDLTKFAFSFRPGGAACNTQIAYFSSRTASPEYYTIAQPSGACVERILKVFSTP